MSIAPTGRIDTTDDGHDILIERSIAAPIGDVWKSLVDPDRMDLWIGTWSGEAGPGKRVMFTMTAEDGAESEEVLIHRCDAPRHLDVETIVGDSIWRMRVELSERDGVTNLVFRQAVDLGDEGLASYGIGWEYYLDRLAAVHSGASFASWDSYYPAQMEHWNNQTQEAASAR
jgi:uncharacterized protein YndB with AHSA1/START domain